jgi:hypothetical protein|nr:MAG TPA: hypothetical protein [Caudoviricetes sp.]
MSELSKHERIKKLLREVECPFFSDDDIDFYLSENNGNENKTLYQMFLIKAEDTTLSVSGLSCADTSKYFRRLAQRYRQNNSRQLKGG